MNSLTKKIIAITTTILVVATFFFAQPTTAYADDPYLDANIPTAGMSNKDLEYMNQHLLDWMVKQNKVFKTAFGLETTYTAYMDRMVKRHGQAPELEIALGTYDTSYNEAQAVQLEAATVLGKQWGFDKQGHVYNREAAISTVTQGREHLRNSRLQLLEAIRTLHRSYNAWHNFLIHRDKK